MRALLIVDVQNDFLLGGALAIPNGDRVLPVINALQEDFELIVACKDWHPPDHISFAIHDKGGIWPIHCVQGTSGAEFAPGLKTQKIEKVFHKGIDPQIDSYSAFYDNAHLRSTGLGEYLKERGVNEVYIVGLATDYCVKYSVHDALEQGFNVCVVLDGCQGIGDIDQVVEEMRRRGADIVTSKEVGRRSTPPDIC